VKEPLSRRLEYWTGVAIVDNDKRNNLSSLHENTLLHCQLGCAVTLIIMALSVMTLSIMTLSITILSVIALIIMTLCMTALSITILSKIAKVRQSA